MIGLENKDSSFIQITSPDSLIRNELFSHTVLLSQRLISASITELMDAKPRGTLVFNDPDHLISRLLRTGRRLNISWGYKKNELGFNKEIPFSVKGLTDAKFFYNLKYDEIKGSLIRRGLDVFITSPNGTGSSNGIVTYNCNFTSFGYRSSTERIIYPRMQRNAIVYQAMEDIGIKPNNMIISFDNGIESVTDYAQDETTMLFLTKMAREWGALFTVNFSSKGEPIGIFISPSKIGYLNFVSKINGGSGNTHLLGYKGEISNVISYTWKSNESESGVGENIQAEIIDGQIIFRRFVAETQKITTYKLNSTALKKKVDTVSGLSLVEKAALFNELLNEITLEEARAKYFTEVGTTSAPQGFGYKIQCKMLGQPLFSPPNQVRLNNGFPDRIGTEDMRMYLYEVTHTITRAGYFTDCEIIDVFTLSPTGLPVI